MTICIAALYDNGKGAVLASDQMITASIPIGYEFEHQEITKIVPLSDPRVNICTYCWQRAVGNRDS